MDVQLVERREAIEEDAREAIDLSRVRLVEVVAAAEMDRGARGRLFFDAVVPDPEVFVDELDEDAFAKTDTGRDDLFGAREVGDREDRVERGHEHKIGRASCRERV